jgi:2'-5' RNA ligase
VIRLFVAIPLPDDVRARLVSLCSGVRDAHWVRPENLHLTLRFIGEVPEPELDDIADALGRLRARQFPMTVSGVGHFESRRQVRALWAGIEPSAALIDLQARIESALVRTGLAPEGRRFSPHITLARMKRAKPAAVRPWLEANGYFRSNPIAVASFVLFASYLGQGGAVYQPVETFALTESA